MGSDRADSIGWIACDLGRGCCRKLLTCRCLIVFAHKCFDKRYEAGTSLTKKNNQALITDNIIVNGVVLKWGSI